MSVMRVRTESSPPDAEVPLLSRLLRRASVSTSLTSKVLPRPPGTRRLPSWPRLTYAYTVSGFTPSSSAASFVVSRCSERPAEGS